ncbi:transporter substrate-binding domain-containing protein [Thiolapillus sp.]
MHLNSNLSRPLSSRLSSSRQLLAFSLLLVFFWLSAPQASGDEAPLPFLEKAFSGDLSEMKKRRTLRALVVYGPTDFFFDKGKPSGIQVDLIREYEKHLNKGIKEEAGKIHVVFIPVSFDRLIPDLLAGKGDIAAHFLTETSERSKKLHFVSGRKIPVDELIVAHKDQTLPDNIDGLAGRKVYVLPGSSYLEHLQKLNKDFKKRGVKPVDIQTVDSHLSSEDIWKWSMPG